MPFLAVRFSNCRLLECTRAKQLLRKHSNCRKTSTTLPKRWNCLCRTRGFSRDLSANELDRNHCKGQWLATERFDISPSTGDLRTVDWCEIWAMRQCSETLDLGTAVQRVFQARELVKALETVGVPQLLRLIQQRRPPIRIPMNTHSARRAVPQHGGCKDHWCMSAIPRVVLACGQHVSSRRDRARPRICTRLWSTQHE